jgi:hypothetical protein
MIHFALESIVSLIVWGVVSYYCSPHIRQVMSLIPAPQEKRRLVNAAAYSFLLTAAVGATFWLIGAGGYGVLEFVGVWAGTGFLEYATNRALGRSE